MDDGSDSNDFIMFGCFVSSLFLPHFAFMARPNICLCITWSRSYGVCVQITHSLTRQCSKEFGNMKKRCECVRTTTHNSKQNVFSFVSPLRDVVSKTLNVYSIASAHLFGEPYSVLQAKCFVLHFRFLRVFCARQKQILVPHQTSTMTTTIFR